MTFVVNFFLLIFIVFLILWNVSVSPLLMNGIDSIRKQLSLSARIVPMSYVTCLIIPRLMTAF